MNINIKIITLDLASFDFKRYVAIRIAIGILELIFGILLLFAKTAWMGSLGTLGIISGAIFLHLTKIGIEVNGDNGLLFYTALFVFVSSFLILWNERKKVFYLGKFL